MRILNKYFSIVMLFMIFSTILCYQNKKTQIDHFISESKEHVVVVEKDVDEQKKQVLANLLKKLTFQDVEVSEKNGITYVKIKCPPEKRGFFNKWVAENKEMYD